MKIVIELPGIKAVSRNETGGHYFAYRSRLNEAEQWMLTYGKKYEYHFTKLVDVLIEAHYDCRGRKKLSDTPNIDDKIFTDILNRWKPSRELGRIERTVWFIEDDSPKYLRFVKKQAIESDHFKVVITISEVVK